MGNRAEEAHQVAVSFSTYFLFLCNASAGKRISKEEGDNRLASSSTM
jgi:hypothetical protein